MDKYSVLKDIYGYSEFRGNQAEIIDSLIEKHDTIAILSTGGGKSICFQIPALLANGITLVITPLISLMQNQVEELKKRKISAEYITSEMEYYDIKKVIDNIENNKVKILYISPERLENERYYAIFSNIDISYIIVDEAHCISIWGQDFRPSYNSIKRFISSLKNRPTIGAFTATANRKVIDDIESVLDMKDINVYKSGFDRPNLFYSVYKPKDKMKFLLKQLLMYPDDVFLIYTVTRKEATYIFQKLKNLGFNPGLYHGGLDSIEKEKCLNKFMNEECKIIVATNAFGMGINKPNIRHVINYSLPLSMEDLSQQSGRCSRDGEEGRCILLFDEEDIRVCEYFIKHTKSYDKSLQKELIKDKNRQLRAVINYATTNKCLHHVMLDYFDEMSKNRCFMCSNCRKKK
jgi:ATP-dependent DNA helicase RecQ